MVQNTSLLLVSAILLLNEQFKLYSALDEWFNTPRGKHVAHAFTAELSHVQDQLKSKNLLQLGGCGENDWLKTLTFQNKWIVHPGPATQRVNIYASLTKIPLARDSIDCILAPLTMEAFARGKNPLDEIDRILKPMGYVVFLGINPFSFWGLSLRCGHLGCFGLTVRWPTSAFTLKRMMMQRGYRQCALMSFYYIPPVKSDFLIRKLTFINEMGKMLWPFPSAFYCLIMRKHQICPFTPLIAPLRSAADVSSEDIPVPSSYTFQDAVV